MQEVQYKSNSRLPAGHLPEVRRFHGDFPFGAIYMHGVRIWVAKTRGEMSVNFIHEYVYGLNNSIRDKTNPKKSAENQTI